MKQTMLEIHYDKTKNVYQVVTTTEPIKLIAVENTLEAAKTRLFEYSVALLTATK